MTTLEDNADERQARLDTMVEEFRSAQKRALLKRGMALWRRTERERASVPVPPPSPSTIN